MLTQLSYNIAEYVARNDLDVERLEVCAYGIEIALYTVLSTISMLAIGCLLGSFWQSVVFIAVYYAIQTAGGGYHAHSHLTCFCTMVIGLIIVILFIEQSYSYEIVCYLTPFVFVYLFCFPLHLHPNKNYLRFREKKIKTRSRLLSSLCMIITFVMLIVYPVLGKAAAAGMICSAISRFAGRRQKYLMCENKKNGPVDESVTTQNPRA